MGGFAPVTDDGYGLGYGITDDTIGKTVFFFNIDFFFSVTRMQCDYIPCQRWSTTNQ